MNPKFYTTKVVSFPKDEDYDKVVDWLDEHYPDRWTPINCDFVAKGVVECPFDPANQYFHVLTPTDDSTIIPASINH